MRRTLTHLVMILGMMALLLAVALSMFEYTATDANAYSAMHKRLDVYESVGVDAQTLASVQADVAAYIRGEEMELTREVTLLGQRQPIFNERERAHMVDVRNLFALERQVRSWAWSLAIVLLAISVALCWPTDLAAWLRKAAPATLWALGGWVLLLFGLGVSCGFNFEAAFLRFHQLLFTNDLWLLDPATDAMIRMYPDGFFRMISREIALDMAFGLLIVVLPFMAGFLPERLLRVERDG